jgi:hypothetical protein
MWRYLHRPSSDRLRRRAARAPLPLPPILAMRRPESDLHTTSAGPLVRIFGTLPSVWSGKYV